MREILFRGKSANNGEWIEGSLLYDPDLELYQISGFNYTLNNDIGLKERKPFDEVVIAETVGQYTGLTDQKGKKIFEGDIVEALEIEGKQIAPIVFRKGCFIVDGNFGIFRIGVGAYKRRQLKVIGNVFDNPELLQAEAGND